MSEDEVSAGTKGNGRNGTTGDQLSLVISVFPYVIVAVFIPVKNTRNALVAQSTEGSLSPAPSVS